MKSLRPHLAVIAVLVLVLIPCAAAYAHDHFENGGVILATSTEADVTLNYYDTNDGTMKFALGAQSADGRSCAFTVPITDHNLLSPEFATPKTDGNTPLVLKYSFMGLKPGKYCAGWFESKEQKTTLGVNNFKDFAYGTNEYLRNFEIISYTVNQESYVVAPGDPTITGTNPAAVDMKIIITKPTIGNHYQAVLGRSEVSGKCIQDISLKGNDHDTNVGTVTSGGTPVSTLSPDNKTYTIHDWWNKEAGNALAPGAYCIGLNKQHPGADWSTEPDMWDLKSFTVPGPIINPTDTGSGTPNPYACVADGTDSYCMLAPIPIPDASGNIDASGKIDVKGGLGNYIGGIIKLIMGIIGVLAVLMIVVGGIEYMSTVSIGEKEGAKNRIVNALLGLLLAVGSYIILNTINPALVNLTVTIPGASLSLDTSVDATPYTGGITPAAASGDNTTPGGTTPTIGGGKLDKWNALMQAAAASTGVECTFGKAIMSVENQKGDPKAYSTYTDSTGKVGHAYGLMELTPDTYALCGGSGDITDPANNINAGFACIKKWMSTGCNGASSSPICNTSDLKYVAAAYNGGAGVNAQANDCTNMTKWECPVQRGGLQQTYDYAHQVITNYTAFKAAGTGC